MKLYRLYCNPQAAKIARIKAGLFQKEVAEAIGITPNAYAQIENRTRSTTGKTACKICECLNADIDTLFTMMEGGANNGNNDE